MPGTWLITSQTASVIGRLILCGVLVSCSTLEGQPPASPLPPLRIVVGPIILEAPITTSSQIYSFEEAPSAETDAVLLAQLKQEIEVRAQRFLTAHLAKQPGVTVVPFEDTRRLLADIGRPGAPLTDAQIRALGEETGADIVVTGLVHDYGKVRWQYWLTGWLLHVSAWTIAIGAATAWNPAAVGAFLAVDATTDVPLWYGGAEIFGWAFRPVRVHLDAVQIRDCQGLIWTDDALRIRVPGKALAGHRPEQQQRKEVQLEANLEQAMADIAEAAGEKLAVQACTEGGKPDTIHGFSFSSLFDVVP